jgi:predicted amidophosphoribosyltransferase
VLEWTKGGGYSASVTNQLIANLKKGVDRRGLRDYRYKEEAIEIAAYNLRNAIANEWLQQATLVPIPPSSRKTDANYDDRMTSVLRAMTRGINQADIRELLVQRESKTPAHVSGDCRPTVAEIMENYEIDESLCDPVPRVIGIFDDILTAGSHFRAAKLVLSARFPGVEIVGVFVARRIFPQQLT